MFGPSSSAHGLVYVDHIKEIHEPSQSTGQGDGLHASSSMSPFSTVFPFEVCSRYSGLTTITCFDRYIVIPSSSSQDPLPSSHGLVYNVDYPPNGSVGSSQSTGQQSLWVTCFFFYVTIFNSISV